MLSRFSKGFLMLILSYSYLYILAEVILHGILFAVIGSILGILAGVLIVCYALEELQ